MDVRGSPPLSRSSFAVCPACRRHVRARETRCPFCRCAFAPGDLPVERSPDPRLGRAAQLAWKLVLGGAGAIACGASQEAPHASPPIATPTRDGGVDASKPAAVTDAGPNVADAADASDAEPPRRNLVAIYGDTMIAITQQIHFRPHSTHMAPSADATLEAVAETLKKNPRIRVEIQGHADASEGGAAVWLGAQRARIVRDKLVELGVAKDHLTVKSYGATRPVAPPDAHKPDVNRRVQFVVTNQKELLP